MKFYIASGLENAAKVSDLAKTLEGWGWEQTYDWTQAPVGADVGLAELAGIAEREIQGVKDADVVIVLLPGARGTHTELGAAIALDKPVFLWAESMDKYRDKNGLVCPFYFCPNVNRFFGEKEKFKAALRDLGLEQKASGEDVPDAASLKEENEFIRKELMKLAIESLGRITDSAAIEAEVEFLMGLRDAYRRG